MHKSFLTNHDILHHSIRDIKVQNIYLLFVDNKIDIFVRHIIILFDFLDTKIYFYYLKILLITNWYCIQLIIFYIRYIIYSIQQNPLFISFY